MSPPVEPGAARPRVLLLSPYFLPAEQGGGSVRAVLYLCQHLRPHFDFVIATRNHDLRNASPYDAAAQARTREATGLDIRYIPPGLKGAQTLRRLMREPFDLFYLNSLVAPDLALLPLLWLGWHRSPARLIAPRGELMPGALAQRPLAKRTYLTLLKLTGLLRHAEFHATSTDEAVAIRTVLGSRARITTASDLPPPTAQGRCLEPSETGRAPGPLRVLFLSRIDPVKNLGFALDVLARTNFPVDFDIAGPIGHDDTWADCQQRMRSLPPQVRARYLGPIPHAEVAGLFATHDLLFLPSLGENHGYVVLEALSSGCPVLLSDRTPWRNLQALGLGADLPLSDSAAFVGMLADQSVQPDAVRQAQRAHCRAYAQRWLEAGEPIARMRVLLRTATQPKARICSIRVGQSGDR